MKNLKKTVTVLLCCTMTAAMAGCASSNSGTPAPADTTTTAAVTESKEVDGKEAENSVTIDRGSEFITIATGATSGIYYPIGGAFATTLSDAGYKTSAQATGASVENINLILEGEAELAIAMQDSVMQAYGGFGAYEEEGEHKNIRTLMRLWPNYVQLVTTANTGIKSVEDLKGKRVGVGAPNSGVELNARMIYEAYGMSYEDSEVDYLSYGEAIDQMKNGQCDAAFVTSGLPNATVSELSTSYDMVIVPIDGEGRESLIKKYPFFSESTIVADTYNNTEDIESVYVYNVLIANEDLDDDLVYDMMNCIFDNIETIKASHNTANKNIDLSIGVSDLQVPLHNGAVRFWKERGFETPLNQ